ncbi:MAG: hypothetical protein DMD96_17260 [Candidatus Rokuibacteriota bacterium]|nr:MAG: hypothetical protein DMD96_17260 [Candidatus Rokubacteria bacterium]
MALRRVRGLPRRVPRLARAPGRLLVDDRRPGRACRRARLLRSRFRSHPLARHQSHRARDVLKFSVQTRELKETAAVPTSEGLVVNLDVSLLFRLRPEAAARVYKTVGSRFEGVVIDPQLRSIIRDVTAEYEAKFLYSASREVVAQNMFKHIHATLAPRGIEAEQVLLRAVQLPPLLTTAIHEKLQAEQQAQRMRFVLDRERQEAERKRMEAQGIADFQSIVARGISPELLKWRPSRSRTSSRRAPTPR